MRERGGKIEKSREARKIESEKERKREKKNERKKERQKERQKEKKNDRKKERKKERIMMSPHRIKVPIFSKILNKV